MSNPTTKFNFFDPNNGVSPFKFNEVYSIDGSNEASLYLSVYTEYVWHYGTDIVFIERETNQEEAIFGEFLGKAITRGTPMRLFLEETEGWGGMGDTYSKFGLQVQDECTLYCPKITFEHARAGLYPKYNDLIYIPKSKKLFEIKHIEDELPPTFYLLGNRAGYVITCKTYTYDHSEIKNDISIPIEIQALDRVLIDPTTSVTYDVASKDVTYNEKIEEAEVLGDIVDNTEVDPLMGG